QRDRQHGSRAANVDKGAAERITRAVSLLVLRVDDMHEAERGITDQTRCRPAWAWLIDRVRRKFGKARGDASLRNEMQGCSIEGLDHPEAGFAQAHRFFQHRLEHWREVSRRRIDDLQYFGVRGLLLQCLADFCNEPRVLDRDHRLLRKILYEFDLLVIEW